jgi:chemotaxis-related protein WspB
MAMVLFNVGQTRFAVACKDVVQVVPNVILKKVPSRSPAFVGLMVWRGKTVPVVDFCQIIEHCPVKQYLHTRIILLKTTQETVERSVGLFAENVYYMNELSPEQFIKQEISMNDYPFLSKGFLDSEGMVFLLDEVEFSQYISEEILHEPMDQ